jgi:3-methyladenine DNA glycosylase AlkD
VRGVPAFDPVLAEVERTLPRLASRPTAEVRAARRRWSRALKGRAARDVVDVAVEIAKPGGGLRRFVACELVQQHPRGHESLTRRHLDALGAALDSWQAVDTFGIYVAGPAWRLGRLSDRDVERWARSLDRWRRRAALVATVPLNAPAHGGTIDARRTLSICDLLVDDRDDMVVKALSWALRELAKRDRASVERWLRRQGERVPARARREVGNLLRAGTKSGKPARRSTSHRA